MLAALPLLRSRAVHGPARPDAATTPQKIATLVVLTTRLADRMDTLPSGGLARDRDRRARIALLRRTAEAGTRALRGWDATG